MRRRRPADGQDIRRRIHAADLAVGVVRVRLRALLDGGDRTVEIDLVVFGQAEMPGLTVRQRHVDARDNGLIASRADGLMRPRLWADHRRDLVR